MSGLFNICSMDQRANITFCFKLRKNAIGTVELKRQVNGDQCLFRTRIIRWYSRFKTFKIVEESRLEHKFTSVIMNSLPKSANRYKIIIVWLSG